MRRYSLIGTTIFTVCLVGILLATGPSRARAERKRARTNTQPHTYQRDISILASHEGRRWQSGQPTHWRAFVLQR